MLIAQITDIHIGFEPETPDELNRQRLDRVLGHLVDGPNRPDLLIASGDLTDRGAPDSYQRIKAIFAALPFPVYPVVGNHDDRARFAETFPSAIGADGFAHYCIALEGLRIIVLDTLEAGRHGGAFCEKRAAWLSARLAHKPAMPTIIVMHHPPFDTGIEWMSTDPREPWVARFGQAIAGHRQIRAIWCGHIHRPVMTMWRGVPITVCPASAPQLSLDLSPIDIEVQDGRDMVNDDPPAFALHRWDGKSLVTHFDIVRDRAIFARYDEKMARIVKHTAHERPPL